MAFLSSLMMARIRAAKQTDPNDDVRPWRRARMAEGRSRGSALPAGSVQGRGGAQGGGVKGGVDEGGVKSVEWNSLSTVLILQHLRKYHCAIVSATT